MATGGAPPGSSDASVIPQTESSQQPATTESTEQSNSAEENMETSQVRQNDFVYALKLKFEHSISSDDF